MQHKNAACSRLISIKKCGSFLKYVVLVSKTVADIFNKLKYSTIVLADGKIVN